MSTSYIDLYEILDVFEDNSYQKIMMGAPYNNPDEIVIINCLKNNNLWAKEIFENAKETLSNLVHSEILPDSLILITEYQEGKTIGEYAQSIKDDNRRYYLSKNYLRAIAKYETFSSYIQTILVDQNQIIIQDNNLLMNNVMILDEQIQENISFNSAIEKIKLTLETIFYTGNQSFENNENERISAFLDTLSPNRNEYYCLSDIVIAYENAFSLSVNNTKTEDDAILMTTGLATDSPVKNLYNEIDNPSTEIPIEKNIETPIEEATKESIEKPIEENSKTNDVTTNKENKVKNIAKQKEVELDGLTVVNEMFDEQELEEKKQKSNSKWGLLLILILLLSAIGYGAYTHFHSTEKELIPLASFVRTVNDDKQFFENKSVAYGENNEITTSEWTVYSVAEDGTEKQIKTYNKMNLNLFIKTPGTYKTALKVQDSKGQWSEVVSEEFVLEASLLDPNNNNSELAKITEKLTSLNINFDTDNVSFVDNVYRSGTQSLLFDLNKGNGTITLNNVFVDNNSILSAWVLSDIAEPIVLNITAYENGKKVFSHKKKHVFKSEKTWEMLQMKLPNKSADKLVITFSGSENLWVDDIDISIFK